MASVGTYTVEASDLLRSHTISVRVKGMGRARVRLWLCVQIIRLAAFVGGLGLKIEDAEIEVRV
jgi:hypothetical protein